MRKRSARVTLRDIAEMTGFTMNTVSRALKDKEDISRPTRKMIQKQAKRLGYIPDAIAVSLRSGSTRTVSVIIPDISDPLFAIWVRDIEMKLKEKNFDLFIQNTNEDKELERRAIVASIGKKIDGIIICPCQKDMTSLDLLQKNKMPFVLMGRRFDGSANDYVIANDAKGGYLATKHLIERGHENILFLNGPGYISSAKERLRGYKLALSQAKIRYRDELVREVKIKTGECSRILQHLLRSRIQFSSIFCFSDLMAWETISYLQAHGFEIPRDLAIVGFDDIQSRLYYPYPLTSVGYGKKQIAVKSVEILWERLENPTVREHRNLVVDTNLVVRKST